MSKLVRELAFGTPKFYIDKINHGLINMSSNCDVKSGLRGPICSINMKKIIVRYRCKILTAVFFIVYDREWPALKI